MMLQYRLCTVIHTVKSHAFLRKNQSLFRITFFCQFLRYNWLEKCIKCVHVFPWVRSIRFRCQNKNEIPWSTT